MHAAFAVSRRERLRFDSAADHRRNLVEGDRPRIETPVRVTQGAQQSEDGASRAKLPRAQWIIRARQVLMCSEKAQHAIDVLRNRGVRAQWLNLERGRAENRGTANRRPRDARPFPLPRLGKTVERVEAAKITGLAQRAIERCSFTFANRLIVLAGNSEIRRAQQGYCGHPRKVCADE